MYSKWIVSVYENLCVFDCVGCIVNGVIIYFDFDGDLLVNGFNLCEKICEDDYVFMGGVKGVLGDGFYYDLSMIYGQDKNLIYIVDFVNWLLFIDIGFILIDFYDGFFKFIEFIVNVDFMKEFDVGMVELLNVVFGGEYCKNIYMIGLGDLGLIYKEGGQFYLGFCLFDVGMYDCENKVVYIDVVVMLVEGLKFDGVVWYEYYLDFGSKVIYKGMGWYDFLLVFVFCGMVLIGFCVLMFVELYYLVINVLLILVFVQLFVNFVVVKLFGFINLKFEKLINYLVGIVICFVLKLMIIVDVYQVKICDCILGIGMFYSFGGGINVVGQLLNFFGVQWVIVVNGNVFDLIVMQIGINIFINGVDICICGIDVVVSYFSDFGDVGSVSWILLGNYNEIKIIKLKVVLFLVNNQGVIVSQVVFDIGVVSNIEIVLFKVKVIVLVFYMFGKFFVMLCEMIYGKSLVSYSLDGVKFYLQKIGIVGIIDIEFNYEFVDGFMLLVGVNNVFDKWLLMIQVLVVVVVGGQGMVVNGGNVYDVLLMFSLYGINGGYYYGCVIVKF